MTSKLKRCTAPGCRTLTADTLCGDHRGTPPPQATTDERHARLAALRAADALSRQWADNADRLDALRADLHALRERGERIERRAEQPTFFED